MSQHAIGNRTLNTRSTKGVMFQGANGRFDETRSLQHYVGILRNRRWFLAGVVSTCLLIALVATFVFPYEYRAKTTVQIEPERTDFYAGWRATGTVAEYRTHYLTLLETLNSNGLARRVVDDLKLWDHSEFSPAWKRALGIPGNESAVIESFRERIRVTTVNGSMLIEVQFAASDPQLASTVLNALVERFISEHGEFKRQLTVSAADWMSEKLPGLNASLEEAQQQLEAFRAEHDLVEVQGSVSLLSEMELSQSTLQLSQTNQELEQTRLALEEAMHIFEDMSDPTETGERLESLEMVRNDPLIQQAWFHKSSALNHKRILSTKYGPKHQFMIDASTRIAGLDAEIAEQIDRIMTKTVLRVALLHKQVSSSASRVDDIKQDVMTLQEKRFQLQSMENNVEMQRRLVNQFYTDTLTARSLEGFDLAGAVVVDPAATPLQPYRPQRAIVLLLVALSSSIFCVLFVFIHEHVDDKIRNTKDVSDKLRMGLLGMMPEFSSTGVATEPDLSHDPASTYRHNEVLAEAVNNVRTMLMTLSSKRNEKSSVLLVTASQSGEGSTTAAVALAHSIGRLERVLLVDCHLRRPAIANMCKDIDINIGLHSLIAGSTSLKDSVRRDALGGNFDVLPCARDTARSTDILASSQFTLLLDQLREQYEWIILDAAPTHQDSGTLLLGRLADAVVYVVRSHSTGLTTILRGIRRVRRSGGYVAGVLINRVDPKRIVSQGGDYDYASYCGDISYKERNDLDIARETIYAGAIRALVAYREFDVATKWDKVNSTMSIVTQYARTAHAASCKFAMTALATSGTVVQTAKGSIRACVRTLHDSIRKVDMNAHGVRLARYSNAARDATNVIGDRTVALCRRVDLSRVRALTEPYRRTMISTATQICDRTKILAGHRLGPLYERVSIAMVLSHIKVVRRVDRMNLQSRHAANDEAVAREDHEKSAENNWLELKSYYMPKEFQKTPDEPFASNQHALNRKAAAKA